MNTKRKIILGTISIGIYFSVVQMVFPLYPSFYMQALIGLMLAYIVPAAVIRTAIFVAERSKLVQSGFDFRFYVVSLVIFLFIFVPLDYFLPADGFRRFYGTVGSFAVAIVLAALLIKWDVDRALWSRIA